MCAIMHHSDIRFFSYWQGKRWYVFALKCTATLYTPRTPFVPPNVCTLETVVLKCKNYCKDQGCRLYIRFLDFSGMLLIYGNL